MSSVGFTVPTCTAYPPIPPPRPPPQVTKLSDSMVELLTRCSAHGLDSDSDSITTISRQGAMVLRMLHALQSFRKEPRKLAAQAGGGALAQAPPSASSVLAAYSVASAGHAPAERQAAALEAAAHVSSAGAAPASTSRGVVGAPASGTEATPWDASWVSSEVQRAVGCVSGHLEPLWRALSDSISVIEEGLRTHSGPRPEASSRILPPGAQQVLPLVEAFFVLCNLQDVHGSLAAPPASVSTSMSGVPEGLLGVEAGSSSAAAVAAVHGGVLSPMQSAPLEASLSTSSSGHLVASSSGQAPQDDKHLPFFK